MCGCDYDSCGNLRRMCESCLTVKRAEGTTQRLIEALEHAGDENRRLGWVRKRGWRWPFRWPYGDLP